MIRMLSRIAPIAVLSVMTVASATAQTAVKIGTLTCTGGEGVGLIIGSQKSYDCNFTSIDGGRDAYSARLTKIGLDIGVTGKSTMVWTVLAAAQAMRPKVLAGAYVGATADASLALGAGVKVLVGGTGKSITLQPVSVQGQTGVNLAVGVAEMDLR